MSIHRFLLPSFLVAALLSYCGPHQDSASQLSPWYIHYRAREEALRQGNCPQAETFYHRTIAVQEKPIGNHPELARPLDYCALLLKPRSPRARSTSPANIPPPEPTPERP